MLPQIFKDLHCLPLDPFKTIKGHSANLACLIRQPLQNLVLEIQTVVYFEGQGHHTKVELADGRVYLHHKSLGKLLHILPENFVRIHKSFVVNVDHIEQLNAFEGSKYELVLNNGVKLPIGRTYYQSFKQSFM